MADVLEVDQVSVRFPIHSKILRRVNGHIAAVTDVSFGIPPGTTLGLVGESGCGKSTLGRAVAGLAPLASGDVIYGGRSVIQHDKASRMRLRRSIQMIFQDPFASLNPRRTVRQIVTEAWDIHQDIVPPAHRRERFEELLELVGLDLSHADRYPHQFSGGQQQRIAIARALAIEPDVLVCDESVSALDVSIQGQIVRLLQRLQQDMGLTYLFITHDLAVMKMIAGAVAVMYLGRIVEIGPTDEVLRNPTHPYTRALLSAVPVPDPELARTRPRIELRGEVPSPADPPSGCVFRTRCPKAQDLCAQTVPLLVPRSSTLSSACHFPEGETSHGVGRSSDGPWMGVSQ